MPRARERRRRFRSERRLPASRPITTAAPAMRLAPRASIAKRPRPWAAFPKMPSGCTICTATCGSGWRIAGPMNTQPPHRRTARRFWVRIAPDACCVVDRGKTMPAMSARPRVSPATRKIKLGPTVFASSAQSSESLNSRIPLVAFVFPISPSSPPYAVEPVDCFDSCDEFRHFVAELSFDPKAQRRAIGKRQRRTIQFVSEDRLRMKRIDEIDALVIGMAAVQVTELLVRAMKRDEARFGTQADAIEHGGERRSVPTADAAPAFDAIVPGDLYPRSQRPEISQRKTGGPRDETVHLKPPPRIIVLREFKVFGRQVVGVLRSVGAERFCDVLCAELPCQRFAPNERSLDAVGQPFRGCQKLLECRGPRQPVAA